MNKTDDKKQDNLKEEQVVEPEVEEEAADSKIQKLTERMGVLEDQLKRAVADYRNLEKRTREDAMSIVSYARGELILKLLPVLDNLEQVVGAGGHVLSELGESKEWFKGVEMSVKQLKQVLSEEGVEEIETKEETLFDPGKHEAIDTGEGQQGMILKVVRKGYNLNGRIIRPTQVIVGKAQQSS